MSTIMIRNIVIKWSCGIACNWCVSLDIAKILAFAPFSRQAIGMTNDTSVDVSLNTTAGTDTSVADDNASDSGEDEDDEDRGHSRFKSERPSAVKLPPKIRVKQDIPDTLGECLQAFSQKWQICQKCSYPKKNCSYNENHTVTHFARYFDEPIANASEKCVRGIDGTDKGYKQ